MYRRSRNLGLVLLVLAAREVGISREERRERRGWGRTFWREPREGLSEDMVLAHRIASLVEEVREPIEAAGRATPSRRRELERMSMSIVTG